MSTPEIVRRQFERVERASEEGGKRIVFVASTDDPDRYQDIVDQRTWKLDHYRANPVVLTDHNYTTRAIVGTGMVDVAEGGLELEIAKWSQRADAQETRMDVEDGIIGAVSVGFRPGRRVARSQLAKDDPRYKEAGYGDVFYDCELLEVSLVAVPANPHALAKGIEGVGSDAAALDALAERVTSMVIDRIAADPLKRAALTPEEPDPLSLVFGL
jgi:hypothetical protein